MRGSVASGTAIRGRSDLDLLVLSENGVSDEERNKIERRILHSLTTSEEIRTAAAYTSFLRDEVLTFRSAAPHVFPNMDVVFQKYELAVHFHF